MIKERASKVTKKKAVLAVNFCWLFLGFLASQVFPYLLYACVALFYVGLGFYERY